MKRNVRKFSRKTLIASTSFSIFGIILSIYQLVMTWFTPSAFSFFLIPIASLSLLDLKVIASTIITTFIILNILFIFKIIHIRKRKMYMHNLLLHIAILTLIFFIYVAIPSAIPLNVAIPILSIFVYIIIFTDNIT